MGDADRQGICAVWRESNECTSQRGFVETRPSGCDNIKKACRGFIAVAEGFSQLAIQILNACGVHNPHTVNVLADNEIRQGIKEYANWPTIPQLYVNGEFVGGSDIMREMYQSGELQKLIQEAKQQA